MTTKHKIIKATAVIFLFSVVGKVLGFVREMIIAAQFGTTASTDAYFVGLSGPDFIREIIAGGVLTAVFIPAYAQSLKNKSKEESDRLLSNISSLLMLVLVIAVIAGMCFPGIVVRFVAPELSSETFLSASMVTRIIFPAMFFMGIASFYGSLLNVHEQFVAPAAAQILLNIGVIAGVLVLAKIWGVNSIAVGLLLGAFLQWAVLFSSVNKFSIKNRFSLRFLPETKSLLIAMVPLFIASLFAVGNDLVSRGLAAGLDTGSVSALNFSNRLRETPWLFCGVPLATAVFPFMSNLAGIDERRKFTDILIFALRLTAFLAIPLCVILFVFNVPVIQILFERGKFDTGSTALTAYALRFASIGAAFYAINYVILRAYYSTQKISFLLIAYAAALVVNLGLGLILRDRWAIGGITLARSVSELLIFIFLLLYLKTFLVEFQPLRQLGYMAGLCLMAFCSALGGFFVFSYIPYYAGIYGLILRLAVGSTTMLLLYVVIGLLTRNKEISAFVVLVKARFNHRNAVV
ncbi:MAG: murein biosynthesis integral membrane protein MurJ [Elusimicrobia bacterium]|nr:murein biosynthesis integral membrane protein MurJ [Elusimicrobiota bacterium]